MIRSSFIFLEDKNVTIVKINYVKGTSLYTLLRLTHVSQSWKWSSQRAPAATSQSPWPHLCWSPISLCQFLCIVGLLILYQELLAWWLSINMVKFFCTLHRNLTLPVELTCPCRLPSQVADLLAVNGLSLLGYPCPAPLFFTEIYCPIPSWWTPCRGPALKH